MEKNCFIQVTQDFKNANEGLQIGCNILKTATTVDGKIVVAIGAVNEFPALFIDRLRLTPLWLGSEDFVTQQNIV